MIDLLSNATTAGIIHIVCCALDPAYCIFGAIYYIDKVSDMILAGSWWTKISEIRQIFNGDWIKFCEIFTKIT